MINVQQHIDKLTLLREYMALSIDGGLPKVKYSVPFWKGYCAIPFARYPEHKKVQAQIARAFQVVSGTLQSGNNVCQRIMSLKPGESISIDASEWDRYWILNFNSLKGESPKGEERRWLEFIRYTKKIFCDHSKPHLLTFYIIKND